MQALTLQPAAIRIDLTNLVGLIRIRGNDAQTATTLSQAIEEWLFKNGWANYVQVAVDGAHEGHEISFIPGEHQSNPEVRLAFNETPDFSRVRFRLEHWLYELM